MLENQAVNELKEMNSIRSRGPLVSENEKQWKE